MFTPAIRATLDSPVVRSFRTHTCPERLKYAQAAQTPIWGRAGARDYSFRDAGVNEDLSTLREELNLSSAVTPTARPRFAAIPRRYRPCRPPCAACPPPR